MEERFTYDGAVKSVLLSIVLIAALAPSMASAEPYDANEGPTSYGMTIFLSDATGLALAISTLALASENASRVTSFGTVAFWGFGGPLIHLLEDNQSGALKSLGLRWGLSSAMATVFYVATTEDDTCEDTSDFCLDFSEKAIAGLGGFLLGGAIAQGVDWFVLAKRPRRASVGEPRALAPSFRLSQESVSLGLGGSW